MPELPYLDNHYQNRWYDKYPEIVKLIDRLKILEKSKRDLLISGMQNIIMEYDSELIDRHVQKFPLTYRRRWYDKDPHSWLVINVLKFADNNLLADIVLYLKERL